MMRKCSTCHLNYDDVFRFTFCPHDKFEASESAKAALRATGHPTEEPATSRPFFHGLMNPDPARDWPPRSSAVGLVNGTRRHGSTGQLFEAQDGQWSRMDYPARDEY